ncbi:MAG: hypothetical protein ACYDD1_02260 [Caulobacteraceae bacterium]
MSAQYPIVPAAAGVPAVTQDPNDPTAGISDDITVTVTPLTADDPSVTAAAAQISGLWGIFDATNTPVITPDSIKSVEYAKDWTISSYPVEATTTQAAGFQSFNKVERPAEAHVTMTQGGTDADRSTFLTAVDTLCASIALVDVVTPEKTYFNMNAVRHSLPRASDKGAKLLTVELVFEEVRVTATTTYTQTAAPAGATPVSGGTVQATTPTSTQATAAAGGAS